MEHTIDVESYQEAYSDNLLNQETYDSIIDYLMSLQPFKAIRLAQEINQMNGFEVVSERLIREWKSELAAGEIVKIKMVCDKGKNENSKIEIAKIEIQNKESKTLQKENSRIKMQQLQRGYMKLLST